MRILHERSFSSSVVLLSAAVAALAGCVTGGSGSGVTGGSGGSGGGSSTVAGTGGATTAATTAGVTTAATTATTSATKAAATTAVTTVTVSSGSSMDPAQVCVDTINAYRATRGLPPYTRWTSNEACVAGEATTDGSMMVPHYAFAHGQSCGSFAQDECPGYDTNPLGPQGITECLGLMWGEKDKAECSGCATCDFPYQNCTSCTFSACGHYLNMKSSMLTTVACGFATNGWYAQNFQ